MAAKRGDAYCPASGDFVQLTLTPAKGREQAGSRPALVVSPHAYNHRVGLCLAFPVTGARKGYPFEVVVPDGLPVHGVVLADQIAARAWPDRDCRLLAKAPPALVAAVLARFRTLLP